VIVSVAHLDDERTLVLGVLSACSWKRSRRFLVRNVHATPNSVLLQPRWAMSFLRGPMTLGDVRRGVGARGSWAQRWVAW
jgi:hypothetical protein